MLLFYVWPVFDCFLFWVSFDVPNRLINVTLANTNTRLIINRFLSFSSVWHLLLKNTICFRLGSYQHYQLTSVTLFVCSTLEAPRAAVDRSDYYSKVFMMMMLSHLNCLSNDQLRLIALAMTVSLLNEWLSACYVEIRMIECILRVVILREIFFESVSRLIDGKSIRNITDLY